MEFYEGLFPPSYTVVDRNRIWTSSFVRTMFGQILSIETSVTTCVSSDWGSLALSPFLINNVPYLDLECVLSTIPSLTTKGQTLDPLLAPVYVLHLPILEILALHLGRCCLAVVIGQKLAQAAQNHMPKFYSKYKLE